MTALTVNGSVTRETRATYRGRPLVVTLCGHELIFREKGRRRTVAVPLLAAYDLGFKILAREARGEKLLNKQL